MKHIKKMTLMIHVAILGVSASQSGFAQADTDRLLIQRGASEADVLLIENVNDTSRPVVTRARPDIQTRPERPDRRVRPERPDRRVRPERPERRVRPERPERSARLERPDRPERVVRVRVRPDFPVRPVRPERS